MAELGSTAHQILDVAQSLVQTRGYNAFSYRDLAAEVGIKTASIHYHFPRKPDLGLALIERYSDALAVELARIEKQESTALGRLLALVDLYRRTESSGCICLCGSMAAEVETLSERVQGALEKYFQRTQEWVRSQVETGIQSREIPSSLVPEEVAILLVSCLQGALLVGRAQGGSPRLDSIERTLKTILGTG